MFSSTIMEATGVDVKVAVIEVVAVTVALIAIVIVVSVKEVLVIVLMRYSELCFHKSWGTVFWFFLRMIK